MLVYAITNTVNGKKYVGITKQTLQKRWTDHHTSARSGCDFLLHRAIRKYGSDVFEVEEIAHIINGGEKALSEIETDLIRRLETRTPNGYNMTEGGEGRSGLAHSPETRAKISAANKGLKRTPEYCRAMSEARKGIPLTTEWAENVRKGHRRGPCSEETRKKISEANSGKIRTPEMRLAQSLRQAGKKYPNRKKVSPEGRQRMSEAGKRRCQRERETAAGLPG